jgi:hypothetical protein
MTQGTITSVTEAKRARVQDILDHHWRDRPEGVTRSSLDFGEDPSGRPALNIELHVKKEFPTNKESIENLTGFVQILVDDILSIDAEYWPYIRTVVEE